MNLVTTGSPNLGSGSTSRLTAARRRDIASLLARPLGAVFGAPLAAVLDALRVERAANDMVAHPGQILDPAAADQHHRMLLQIMAFARDIAGNLETVGQPHPRLHDHAEKAQLGAAQGCAGAADQRFRGYQLYPGRRP